MKIKNVSRHFNKDFVYDGYTNAFLFQGHTTAHNDHASSGATSRRRTLRTAVETAPPARRVVKIYTDYWLVGNSNVDSFNSAAIRRSYGLKKSTGLMALLTPAEACQAAVGTPLHAQKEFYRDTSNPLTESETDVMWNIFCPLNELVKQGSFLRQDGRLFRVRSAYPTVDEYLVAESDELDVDAYQSAVFTSAGDFDVASDTFERGGVQTSVIQFDDAKLYRFADLADSDRRPGDLSVITTASVGVGARFAMLGSNWQVTATTPEGDAQLLHVRLA